MNKRHDMGEKRKRGKYRCQPEEEIIALLFLLVLPSLRPPSLLLPVPNLVWCQTTGLGNADREEEGETRRREKQERSEREGKRKMRKGGRILPLFYPLAITLFFPSLSLSRVLIITRFCVTSLNKALPCLSHFLPASVCMRAPLQGLTIIRSRETDAHTLGMLGDGAQCRCLQIQG